jgi:hypothetical protein
MATKANETTATIINNATNAEFKRLTDYLKSLGVLRNSMLGDEWLVIYSEQGPIDITIDRLKGN